MATVLTTSNDYRRPLKCKIIFKSNDGTNEYFTFNAFTGSDEINVIYCDVERAAGETGSFNVIVEDSANIINKDHLRNTRVYIQLGKTQSELQYYFIGKGRIFNIRRPRMNYQEYLISGPSTKTRAAELMLLVRKAANIQDVTNPLANPSPAYGIANIIKDMITRRKSTPLNRQDIQEITGWQADLVSEGGEIADELNAINLPVINEVYTTLWDFLERMMAITGGYWDIDYDATGQEIFKFNYPSTNHSGVIIKANRASNDQADKISYIRDSFTIEDNSTSDAGFASRLYTSTIIDKQSVSSSFSNQGSTTLTSRAIAQQIVLENDERRITDFAFVLSKIGDPSSPKDRVNGDLVMDSGDNKPTGRTLCTFHIPLSDIKSTPTTVFVNDVDVKVRFLQGENAIWLRLFQRSGTDGNPNTDSVNYIRWHHNGVTNITQAVYTATAPGGDYKTKEKLLWSSNNQGPIYTYGVFSNIRRLQARTNVSAAKNIDLIEAFYDSSFLDDYQTVNRALSLNLAHRSKTRRTIQDFRVSIPNNFLFKPYQLVEFNDNVSGQSQTLQVARARYVISALPGDHSPGANWCDLSLQGEFNSILGDCSCS